MGFQASGTVSKPLGPVNAVAVRRPLSLVTLLGGLLLASCVTCTAAESAESPPTSADPLAAAGYQVTSGAAPGYVPDRLCGSCHVDLFASYQEVGMARSFYRPRPETAVEDFDDVFYHAESERYYRVFPRDGRYVFERYQLDADGSPVNVFEREIDWIMGSGNHSRTYLFHAPGGELFQLPLAWYSETAGWGMAPGYDRPDHEGVGRRVRRECMFCHNAYPDVAAGSDDYAAPQVFPTELPEGLGCQRCHGPGAEHSRIGMSPPVDFKRLAESIVNPGRLAPELRDDICYGCHMQPTVALAGVRHFGRADYSFQPGEPLPDYLVLVDVDEEGHERSERFEINHHPYRLKQSRCFSGSDGALSCLSCHDPHRKVPEAKRAAHYRAACLGCHQLEDCRLEEMAAAGDDELPAVDAGDCAGCHMAKRRPTDVVQVVMTDHLIRRVPAGDELTTPLEESEPVLIDVKIMEPDRTPGGDLAEVYRAAAVARAGGGVAAVERLEQMLARVPVAELDPYFDLARGQLKLRWSASAARTLTGILAREPDHLVAREWLAIAESDLGRVEGSIALLRETLELGSDRVETHFNLARLLSGQGRPADSIGHFRRALDARPNMDVAHFHLGRAYAKLGRPADAAASYRRALEIDPRYGEAYLGLAWAQGELGDHAAALATLRHGARAADQPDPIRVALERLTATVLPDEPAGASPESSE